MSCPTSSCRHKRTHAHKTRGTPTLTRTHTCHELPHIKLQTRTHTRTQKLQALPHSHAHTPAMSCPTLSCRHKRTHAHKNYRHSHTHTHTHTCHELPHIKLQDALVKQKLRQRRPIRAAAVHNGMSQAFSDGGLHETHNTIISLSVVNAHIIFWNGDKVLMQANFMARTKVLRRLSIVAESAGIGSNTWHEVRGHVRACECVLVLTIHMSACECPC